MAQITVQDLQNIAVECTSNFFNKNIPLNESLCKIASERDLNKDQLKRAIEATNTLTYLKNVEVSKDRTSEFKVADYDSIMKLASIPDNVQELQKQASSTADMSNRYDVTIEDTKNLIKTAEEKLSFSFPNLNEKEKLIHLRKYAQINDRALEKAQEDLEYTGLNLIKLAKEIRKNSQSKEFLSALDIDDERFEKIAELVLNEKVKRLDYAKTSGLFKAAQLQSVKEFVDFYKVAEDLYSEIEYRKTAKEKIRTHLDYMEKAAFGPAIAAITGMTRLLGSSLPRKIVVNKNLLTKEKIVNGVAEKVQPSIGKQMGGLMGSSVGGSIKKRVVKPAGELAASTAKSAKNLGEIAVNNVVAITPPGKNLGVTKKPMPPGIKRKITAGLTVGGYALDASAFSPKIDPINDYSGDVWQSLQSKL